MRGSVTNDDAIDDLAAFGAPSDVVEALTQEDHLFEIWPENKTSLEIFLRLRTQWVIGFNGVIGLNYSSVEMMLRLFDVSDHRETFLDIQAMEIAILPILNEKGS